MPQGPSAGRPSLTPSPLQLDVIRRAVLGGLAGAAALPLFGFRSADAGLSGEEMIIDDFTQGDLTSRLGTQWRGVSDKVMGGISQERVSLEAIDGQDALRLTGDVRLENNGGFIQVGLNLAPGRGLFDASRFTGLRLKVRGNGERYSVHLRTPANVKPWQSYRAHFEATPAWQDVRLPFSGFTPYRLTEPLDVSRLRRVGLVAIGRAFSADLAVSEIAFYA